MPGVGPVGGRYGVIGGNSGVRNWQLNDEHQAAAFVNSATRAGTGRRPGIYSWGGSYQEHGAQPFVMPGLYTNFVGYTAPANGVRGTSGNTYSGSIIVDACSILWDWASGQVLSSQSQFSGNLALTTGTGTYTDSGVSDPEPIGPCKITWQAAAGGTETSIKNITQASLNFSAANPPYVNSDTNSNTGRAPGNIDWNASLNIEDDLLYGGLVKGTAYIFKFYTSETEFYELKWGLAISSTNLVTNEETGAIISYTLNLGMNGTQNLSGTPTLGHILLPDTTTYWGT